MDSFDKTMLDAIAPPLIGFKITAKPYEDKRHAIAFSKMMSDLLIAALSGNLAADITQPPVVCPLLTGYIGLARVLKREDGLKTVQNLLERYRLMGASQIVWKDGADELYRHYAGADLGPFERHLEEQARTEKWLAENPPAPTP